MKTPIRKKSIFQLCCLICMVVILVLVFIKRQDRYILISSSFTSMATLERHSDISKTIDPNTFDPRQLPSEALSALSLLNVTADVKLGDFIHVKITLRNSLGRDLARGGDVILCWMKAKGKAASLTGNIVDHMNGSYTGILRAMWTGSAILKCAIGCTREGLHLMMDYFRHHGTSKKIFCIFEKNKHKILTYGVTSVWNDSQVCNLTAENYGLPWYCGRPAATGVQCSDWTKVCHEEINIKSLYGDKYSVAYYLRATSHRVFTNAINITVKSDASSAVVASRPCPEVDVADTWSWMSPIGYFYNNTWQMTNCMVLNAFHNHECLKNRRMLLYGDSTVRQWFFRLFNQLELKFSTEVWNVSKWHRQSVAKADQYNFTLVWTRHGLPIYFGETNRGETRPVFAHLDQIPQGSNDIILINLYAHFQYHHPKVFTRNLRKIVSSVRSLLIRAPGVKVAVKGPHYFSFRDRKTLGGMWGPLYRDILKREFKGLYSQVYYVDIWDMTVARESRDMHPMTTLVKSMISVFLNYVCS